MTPCSQPQPPPNLEKMFAAQIQALQSPYRHYRVAANRFLAYLQTDFPDVRNLSDLRRDPHLLGWIRSLGQEHPPLSNYTRLIYLIRLRRLLRDLAPEGQPGLILSEDFAMTKCMGAVAQISRMLRWMPFQCRTFLGQPYFVPGSIPNMFFMPSVTPAQ
jgi:hypothetical protein